MHYNTNGLNDNLVIEPANDGTAPFNSIRLYAAYTDTAREILGQLSGQFPSADIAIGLGTGADRKGIPIVVTHSSDPQADMGILTAIASLNDSFKNAIRESSLPEAVKSAILVMEGPA